MSLGFNSGKTMYSSIKTKDGILIESDSLSFPPTWKIQGIGPLSTDGINMYRLLTLPVRFDGSPALVGIWGRFFLGDCKNLIIQAGNRAQVINSESDKYPVFGLTAYADHILVLPGKNCSEGAQVRAYGLYLRNISIPKPEATQILVAASAVLIAVYVLWKYIFWSEK